MSALAIGDDIPAGTLADADGAAIDLKALKGAPLVVYFYPKADTPGCTNEAKDFSALAAEFAKAGVAVLGVSKDAPKKLAKFRDNQSLTFPLLSDPEHATLEAYGAWGEKTMYGKKRVGVIRSTVVVGADGRVEVAQYNVKATGHVAKLLRDLKIAA